MKKKRVKRQTNKREQIRGDDVFLISVLPSLCAIKDPIDTTCQEYTCGRWRYLQHIRLKQDSNSKEEEENKPMKYSILYRFTFYAHVVYKRSFYVVPKDFEEISFFSRRFYTYI
jgi:hypothetical protein